MSSEIHLTQCRALVISLIGLVLGASSLMPGARAEAAWLAHAENPQRTALSSVAAQPLEAIHWSTPVDLAPPAGEILIHYGSPLVTSANTVIVPDQDRNQQWVQGRREKRGGRLTDLVSDHGLHPADAQLRGRATRRR